MTRFVVFGAVLTLGTLVTDWARAECSAEVGPSGKGDAAAYCLDNEASAPFAGFPETCQQEAEREALRVDDVDTDDVAGYVEGCEFARSEWLRGVDDVDSANLLYRAQAAVVAAPEFCAVTVVQRDATRGWVAVCELVSEGGAL